MYEILKKDLKQLIEPHFYNDLDCDTYEVIKVTPFELLSYSRLDIAFKLLYLDYKEKEVEFSNRIYCDHIRALSLDKFIEPGKQNKNSIEKFINDFKTIFEDIKMNDFDDTKTLVPLSKNGSIANGSHRVASAIFLNKNVSCVNIETHNHLYDYNFFYNRKIPTDTLDIVVTKFIEYAQNVHLAFIWPTAVGKDKFIKQIIPNILYRKNIKLNENGAHNLISQIYYKEEWLGTANNNFRGSQGKMIECFKTFEPVRVIAFQATGLDEVKKIKGRIRDLFNIGKHSIHITDTKEEAFRTANIVFNNNSVHFLNYAKPNKYLSTYGKVHQYKNFLIDNNVNSADTVLDASIILSVYGLRESRDIDYFIADNNKITIKKNEIDNHDSELLYHDTIKEELIYSPEYHFFFNDIKWVSFSQLYKMKNNRGEKKDINDCKMMEALIDDNKKKEIVNKFKQILLYKKIKIRINLVHLLKTIGIYKSVKYIFSIIKNGK